MRVSKQKKESKKPSTFAFLISGTINSDELFWFYFNMWIGGRGRKSFIVELDFWKIAKNLKLSHISLLWGSLIIEEQEHSVEETFWATKGNHLLLQTIELHSSCHKIIKLPFLLICPVKF